MERNILEFSATHKPCMNPPPKPIYPSNTLYDGTPVLPYSKVKQIPPLPTLSKCVIIVETKDPFTMFGDWVYPRCGLCEKKMFRWEFGLKGEVYVCRCCCQRYDVNNAEDYETIRKLRERLKEDLKDFY